MIGQNDSLTRVKRGRPKKKPEYNKEQNTEDLLNKAVELFKTPLDDREKRPPNAPSIQDVADAMNTSRMRVRKLLITAGYYSTEMSREVNKYHEAGLSVQEICEKTGFKRSAVHSVLPYEKGIYKLEEPTLSAEQCQQFRKRKKSLEWLREELTKLDDESCEQNISDKHSSEQGVCDELLWEAITAFEGYGFQIDDNHTSVNGHHAVTNRVRYSVDGEGICFGTLRLTKAEIINAFRKARQIQAAEGCVSDANDLCCRGARELYAVFLRIGACDKSVSDK